MRIPGVGGVFRGEVRVSDASMAWEQWVGRYGAAAALYARQWARASDVEDVVQEGFVRFWQARERARSAGLLFAAVRSAALDLRRGESRRKRREGAVEARWFQESGAGEIMRREEVERALAGLPAAQREVVVLKIWGGLTCGEIAAVVGEAETTVAGRYRSGLEKLAGVLADSEVPRG
jgi:RNA polymerase sigma-70 factor (ECF subfamily)